MGTIFAYAEEYDSTSSGTSAGVVTMTYNGQQSYRGSSYDAVSLTNSTSGRLPATTYYAIAPVFAEAAQAIDDVPCPPMEFGPAETIYSVPVVFDQVQNSAPTTSQFYCGQAQASKTYALQVTQGPNGTVTVPAGTFQTTSYSGTLTQGGSVETYTAYVAMNDLVRLDFSYSTNGSVVATGTLMLSQGSVATVLFPPLDVSYN